MGTTWDGILEAGLIINNLGINLTDSFARTVNNGTHTRLWDDIWISNVRLADRFPRLYRLECNPRCLISDQRNISANNDLNGSFRWCWTRTPTGRTATELSELDNPLRTVTFRDDIDDGWKWKLNTNDQFRSSILTELINIKILSNDINSGTTLLNRLVPKKIEIFVWRARQSRLPTLCELNRRGIDLDSLLCLVCGNVIESVEHALFKCELSVKIWRCIFQWCIEPIPRDLNFQSMLQGKRIGLNPNDTSNTWQAIEWTTAHAIWSNRNQVVFKKKKMLCYIDLKRNSS
ncbi:uncharacterized protein [Rutidosis leptorrhynchoides]|uniref:uncharacterized protein n=1 Tax=Rutidosis leptorrhynchoides TaxID=125765 RepID=UPI003A9A3071